MNPTDTQTNDGGPARPYMEYGPNEQSTQHPGASLRDEFAKAAICGRYMFGGNPELIAKEAYDLADAMLRARALPAPPRKEEEDGQN